MGSGPFRRSRLGVLTPFYATILPTMASSYVGMEEGEACGCLLCFAFYGMISDGVGAGLFLIGDGLEIFSLGLFR